MRQSLLSTELLRALEQLALPTRRGMIGQLAGERRSPRRGSSVEFADFRAYSRGDDIRQIDWNLYARLERFYLKLFVAEEELTVHLLLDVSRSMQYGDPDKLEYARRLAAAFGYLALSNGDRVRLSVLADHAQPWPALRGRQAAAELFAALERQQPAAAVNLAATTRRTLQAIRHGGPLIFCSDLLVDDWPDVLRALSSRPYDVLVLHILAPQELRPPLSGELQLQDSESGQMIDVSVDDALITAYQQRLQGWLADVAAFCSRRGIAYQTVDSATPLEGFLFERLRRSGVLR